MNDVMAHTRISFRKKGRDREREREERGREKKRDGSKGRGTGRQRDAGCIGVHPSLGKHLPKSVILHKNFLDSNGSVNNTFSGYITLYDISLTHTQTLGHKSVRARALSLVYVCVPANQMFKV